MTLPVVKLIVDRAGGTERCVGVEIDGYRVPGTTLIRVEDGIESPPRVTIEVLAVRVSRQEEEPQ